MKRLSLMGAALAVLTMALAPSSAGATVIELGATKTAVTAPICPTNLPLAQCTIILARSTALETVRDGLAYPTTVRKPGQIVAFTVGLSSLSPDRATRKSLIHDQDLRWGGTAQVQVTVLRQVGSAKKRIWKVVGESPAIHVEPYLGEVPQFPLQTSLAVQPKDVIALTTPTWTPALSILQSAKKFAYRQSRKANCANPPNTPQAQVTVGQKASYGCNYPGTRVEYSATEITNPTHPKNYVHAPDIVARSAWAPRAGGLSISGGAGL